MHSQSLFSVSNLTKTPLPFSQAPHFVDTSRSQTCDISSCWPPNQFRSVSVNPQSNPRPIFHHRIHPYRAPGAQISDRVFDAQAVRNKLIKALLNNQQNPVKPMNKPFPSQPLRKMQASVSSDIQPKLMGFYTPDTNPAEEYLWNNNFFGCQSMPQLTYTLVYLMGKILGLRTGPQLMQLRLCAAGQFRLIPLKQAQTDKDPLKYDLLYIPGTEAMLSFNQDGMMYVDGKRLPSLAEIAQRSQPMVMFDHFVFYTPRGYLIRHCAKNNHQRCLVCLHTLLLKSRNA